MPRPRKPERDKAKQLWLESGATRSIKSIAEELGVPEARVRKWKCVDKWELERPKKKGGAPKGNKNAKGRRAPVPALNGNKNAVVTGAFENIFYDSLDEGERELLAAINHDEKETLKQQIGLLMVRERRMMKRLQELRAGAEMIDQKERYDQEMVNIGGAYLIKPGVTVATVKETKDDRIQRIEEALTRIQAEIRRCVDSLRQLNESELKYF